MAVGTALAIGGLINAGMGLFGAHKASSAAKDAAKIQQEGADKAMGVQRDVYNQQMMGMDPYANVGRQAMNTLGRLTSPGQPYTPQLQRYDARTGYGAYGGVQQPPTTFGGMSGSRPRGDAPPQGEAMPRPGTGGGFMRNVSFGRMPAPAGPSHVMQPPPPRSPTFGGMEPPEPMPYYGGAPPPETMPYYGGDNYTFSAMGR
jgi:hypothetical protein